MKKLASKCACSTSGIGICLCIVFMTIGIGGTTLVGISKNANSMTGMASNSMPDMTARQPQNIFVNFFSGIWGEVILLISFGLMFYGMWSSGGSRKKLLPLSAVGAVILYVSMYAYFSLAMEIVGSIVLAIIYASTYSYRIATAIKLA
ncbi:MAG: hypothetical protein HY295_06905 [Thaumarchaeota archaeon]|nr:hypothetical protein [Nitrososphaerota archaeon]